MTGKICFKTHDAALTRAGEILTEDSRKAGEWRAYKCVYCGHYHLTGKPPR